MRLELESTHRHRRPVPRLSSVTPKEIRIIPLLVFDQLDSFIPFASLSSLLIVCSTLASSLRSSSGETSAVCIR